MIIRALNPQSIFHHLQDPFVIGSALTGLGSVIGGLFGFGGQNNANKTNLQIARETNAANRANQEYQNEWNLNMWNKQNEYNDPSAQRQRLEDAGLNPIFYGLDGTGNAGALQSAPFEAQNGFPMENSGAFLGQSIQNAIGLMADVKLKEAQTAKLNSETQGQDIANRIATATEDSVIAEKYWSFKVTKSLADKTDEERKEIGKRIEEIGQNIDVLKSRKEQLDALVHQINNSIDNDNRRYWLEEDRYFLDAFVAYSKLVLEDRKVSIDEALYTPELLYLTSLTDNQINEGFERLTKFVGGMRQQKADIQATETGTKVAESTIRLNDENAKFIGKKNDMYVYELIINGVKTTILCATMLK